MNSLERSELERRNRIRLSVAAYAYEFEAVSIMTDHEFDELSKKIDLNVVTGNGKLDVFFRNNFNPATGMWVRSHPEKHKLKRLLETYYKGIAK